jgi:hypothetical protein
MRIWKRIFSNEPEKSRQSTLQTHITGADDSGLTVTDVDRVSAVKAKTDKQVRSCALDSPLQKPQQPVTASAPPQASPA